MKSKDFEASAMRVGPSRLEERGINFDQTRRQRSGRCHQISNSLEKAQIQRLSISPPESGEKILASEVARSPKNLEV